MSQPITKEDLYAASREIKSYIKLWVAGLFITSTVFAIIIVSLAVTYKG